MKKSLLLLAALACLCSCKTVVRTYESAEKEFCSSLTFRDTVAVLALGQNFMDALKSGNVNLELDELCVLDGNTLYKVSDESKEFLAGRFNGKPITDYALSSYVFSTAGINDLTYRYTYEGTVDSAPAFKMTFNPVKVGGNWYLTLKDGNMPMAVKGNPLTIHPKSDVPAPIVLNTQAK